MTLPARATVPRVGREVEPPRASGDGFGPPERSLHVDILRFISDRRGIATHDACQRLDLLRVRDDTDLFIDRNGAAIEQFELFARSAPTHFETTVNLVKVKDMRSMTIDRRLCIILCC